MDFWYALTADSVCGPNAPSAVTFNAFCSAVTAVPREPTFSVVVPCCVNRFDVVVVVVPVFVYDRPASARHTLLVTIPSTLSVLDFWYALTADSVCGPKTPSAEIFSSCCRARTADPVEPRRTVVLKYALRPVASGVTGTVDAVPPGVLVTLVHAFPVHHEVRCMAPSQLKLKWMWSVCGLEP